jgi:hypothetical protein
MHNALEESFYLLKPRYPYQRIAEIISGGATGHNTQLVEGSPEVLAQELLTFLKKKAFSSSLENDPKNGVPSAPFRGSHLHVSIQYAHAIGIFG